MKRGYLKPSKRAARKALKNGYTPAPNTQFSGLNLLAPILTLTGVAIVGIGLINGARKMGLTKRIPVAPATL